MCAWSWGSLRSVTKMSNWEGFTDEDLVRMRGEDNPRSQRPGPSRGSSRSGGRKKPSGGRSRPPKKSAQSPGDDLNDGCYFNSEKLGKPGNPFDTPDVATATSAIPRKTAGLSTYGTCVVDPNGEATGDVRGSIPPDAVMGRTKATTGEQPEKQTSTDDVNSEENDANVRVCTNEDLQRSVDGLPWGLRQEPLGVCNALQSPKSAMPMCFRLFLYTVIS